MSNSDLIEQLSELIESTIGDRTQELEESLDQVRAMMQYEDRGWTAILGVAAGDRTEGLELDDVKSISEKARTKVAAAALEKRAVDLHYGFVFGQGLEIDGTARDPEAKGRTPDTVRFFEDPINQENLFSAGAQMELSKARFTDGNVVVIVDKSTRQVRRVPVSQIAGVYVNPDFADEIWAWLREWDHYNDRGESEVKREWVITNRAPQRVRTAKTLPFGRESVKVRPDSMAVDLRVNRQTGWAFGVPDAVSGMLWTEAYGQVLQYGKIVNEQLAKVVYKVVSKKKETSTQVGVKMRGTGVGGTAVVGEGQDIQLVNASQKSFDFTAARPLAAMAASAWNISVIDMLADSSAAGSSYGAGNLLTAGMQNAMRGMQNEWSQLFQDVFEILGMGRPGIHWPPMEEPDKYRQAQELTLYGVALHDDEYRGLVLDRLDIPGNPKDIPPSLELRNAKPQQNNQNPNSNGAQASSPDQGRGNGTGGSDSGSRNDLRSDNIESVRLQMATDDLLREMRELLDEMKSLKS